jgi:hypothetical protein
VINVVGYRWDGNGSRTLVGPMRSDGNSIKFNIHPPHRIGRLSNGRYSRRSGGIQLNTGPVLGSNVHAMHMRHKQKRSS